jgi:hypothetical protein
MSKRSIKKFRHRTDKPLHRPFGDLSQMGVLRGKLKRGEITFDQIPAKFKAPVITPPPVEEDTTYRGLEVTEPENVPVMDTHEEHVHGEGCTHH